MKKKKTKIWVLKCSGCKVRFTDDAGNDYWLKAEDLESWWDNTASDLCWEIIEGKAYCPECWEYVDSETFEIRSLLSRLTAGSK